MRARFSSTPAWFGVIPTCSARVAVTLALQTSEAEQLGLKRLDLDQRVAKPVGQFACGGPFKRIGGAIVRRGRSRQCRESSGRMLSGAEFLKGPGRRQAPKQARPVHHRFRELHGRRERSLEAVGGVHVVAEQPICRPPHERAVSSTIARQSVIRLSYRGPDTRDVDKRAGFITRFDQSNAS